MVKDVDLFAAAMADVKPLDGRRRASVSPKPKAEDPDRPSAASPAKRARQGGGRDAPGSTTAPELAVDGQGFDRDIWRALGRGKLAPRSSLDLHGLTLAAAERAVSRFLAEATAQDLRLVLIVTGKGLRLQSGRVFGGLIREELMGWLNRPDNRGRVRGVRPAHPRHGGSGAFYVLLRRRSSANLSPANLSPSSLSLASSRSLRAKPQR